DRMRRRILCVSPCERPDPHLIRAAARAGAQPVLDLGNEVQTAAAALEQLAAANVDFGVRIGSLPLEPDALPASVRFVVLDGRVDVARWRPRDVFVQVTSIADA